MSEAKDNNAIQLFEDKQIRTAWDAEREEWYFSIVDVISVLTDQKTPRGASNYWAKLKQRLKDEGANELLTNCQQLKMTAADGKKRLTDVADTEQILQLSSEHIRVGCIFQRRIPADDALFTQV